jgi:hypothetical protein
MATLTLERGGRAAKQDRERRALAEALAGKVFAAV